jgi:predicted AAA+ superfamily ATPase
VKKLERIDIGKLLLQGGYPEAVSRTQADRRAAWFASYVTTILKRDIRDLAQIDGLLELPKLLSLLAARSSTLMNVAEISRAAGIAHTTLKRYLALLQLTYLLRPLPPWSTNLSKRLIKTSKVHLVDTGLAAYLARRGATPLDRDDSLFGNLLETFVVMELSKQSAWSEAKPSLYHFRTAAGREVDIVLEGPANKIVGVEVKASSSINNADFAGLRELADIAKKKFVRGILLYDGDTVLPFGDQFVAVPISGLWSI